MNLELLNLSYNCLSGQLPVQVAALSTKSSTFDLSHNLLEGELPWQLSQMNKVQAIDLSSNKFNSTIPDLRTCSSVEVSPKSKKHGDVGLAVAVDDEPPRSSTGTMTAMTDMERVFRCFDEDGDGKISPAELRSFMQAAGEELSAEEAAAALESSDSDGDGMLGVEDFVRMVEAEGEAERGRNLKEAFEMYAEQGKQEEERRITARSLGKMLRKLGESKTAVECKAMIRAFDLNGDGVLSFDEFKIMMH